MITITAYTDPIPADVIVNDPMQKDTQVNEEEAQSDFALLLAGLLQDVESAEISADDSELDALTAGKIKAGNRLNNFTNETEKSLLMKSGGEIDLQNDNDVDPIDAAIDKKHLNFLSADHLFNSSLSFDDISGEENVFLLSDEFLLDLDTQALGDLALNAEGAASNRDSIFNDIPRTENSSVKDSSFISAKTKTDTILQSHAASESVLKQNSGEANIAADKKANAAKDSQSSVSEAFNKTEKAGMSAEKENASAGRQNENSGTSGEASGGKLDEYRRGLRKDRVSFEVRDLRTGTNITNNSEHTNTLAETAAGRVSGSPVQEITLDLRLPDYSQQAAGQAQTAWEAKAPAALENMLARELHQNFNGDIVRHASMILRNGGEGIIKLALHPETLGNVKIHLEMAENKITGFIFVESEEAMNAFRREITALEQAFMEQGFAEANLDLSLTSDGERQELEEPSFIAKTAASGYEDSYESETAPIVDVLFGHKTGSVNMLA